MKDDIIKMIEDINDERFLRYLYKLLVEITYRLNAAE